MPNSLDSKWKNKLMEELDEIELMKEQLSVNLLKFFQFLKRDVLVVLDKHQPKSHKHLEGVTARLEQHSHTLSFFLNLLNSFRKSCSVMPNEEVEEEEEERAVEISGLRDLQANPGPIVSCNAALYSAEDDSKKKNKFTFSPQANLAQCLDSTSKLESTMHGLHENSVKDQNDVHSLMDIENISQIKSPERRKTSLDLPPVEEDTKVLWSPSLTETEESKLFACNPSSLIIPELPVKDHMEMETTVTHVVSPTCFYLQPLSCIELYEMMSAFNWEISKRKVDFFLPSLGSFVWACFTEDEYWYRAKVLDFDDDNDLSFDEQSLQTLKVHVKYIDYGNLEWLPLSRLCVLEAKYAKLPQQAIATSLAYVSPPQEVSWTRQQVEWFRNKVLNHTIYAVFHCLQDARFATLYNEPKVDGSYRVQSSCIATMMRKEGLAICSFILKYSGSSWHRSFTKEEHSDSISKNPCWLWIFVKQESELQECLRHNDDHTSLEGHVMASLAGGESFQESETSSSWGQDCLVQNGDDGIKVGHTSPSAPVMMIQTTRTGGVEVSRSGELEQKYFLNEDAEAASTQPERIHCDVGGTAVPSEIIHCNTKAASVKLCRMPWNVGPPVMQPRLTQQDWKSAAEKPRKMPNDSEAAAQVERNSCAADVAVKPSNVPCGNRSMEKSGSVLHDVEAAVAMHPGSCPHHVEVPLSHPDSISLSKKVVDTHLEKTPLNVGVGALHAEMMSCNAGVATMELESRPSDMQPGRAPWHYATPMMNPGRMCCDDKAAGEQTVYLPCIMQRAKVQPKGMRCEVDAAAGQEDWITHAVEASLMRPQRPADYVKESIMESGNNIRTTVASATTQLESMPSYIMAAVQQNKMPCDYGIAALESGRMPHDMDTLVNEPMSTSSYIGTMSPEPMWCDVGVLQMHPEVPWCNVGATVQQQRRQFSIEAAELQARSTRCNVKATIKQPLEMSRCDKTKVMQMDKTLFGVEATAVQPSTSLWELGATGLKSGCVQHFTRADITQPGGTSCNVGTVVRQEKIASNAGAPPTQPERNPHDVREVALHPGIVPRNVGSAVIQKDNRSMMCQ
uniref:uncharacterized protein n=1 Tax=Myxine glutinosa TaxID=7769 RepID=UPI00358FE86B